MDARGLFRLSKDLQALALELTADEAAGGPAPTASEIAVVEDLVRHPGSTIGAVAGRTRFAQGSVSKVVAALVDSGYAESHADPADRRRTLVTLTPATVSSLRSRGTRPLGTALAARGLTPATARAVETLLDDLAGLLAHD